MPTMTTEQELVNAVFPDDNTKTTCMVCEDSQQSLNVKFCNHCGATMNNNQKKN